MGSRGTYAAGRDVEPTYKTVNRYHRIKVLEGINGKHGLPEESHSSEAYCKLFKNGDLCMLRFYDKDKYLVTEIGFHPKPGLTGHSKPVYHIHEYTRNFERSSRLFTSEDYRKYGKYLSRKGHLK